MQPSHCCECRGLVGAHADQQLPSNDRASHHAASKLTVPKTSFELIWRGGLGSARTYWCVRSTTQKSSRTTSPRREYAKTGVCSGGKTERRCRSLQRRGWGGYPAVVLQQQSRRWNTFGRCRRNRGSVSAQFTGHALKSPRPSKRREFCPGLCCPNPKAHLLCVA